MAKAKPVEFWMPLPAQLIPYHPPPPRRATTARRSPPENPETSSWVPGKDGVKLRRHLMPAALPRRRRSYRLHGPAPRLPSEGEV